MVSFFNIYTLSDWSRLLLVFILLLNYDEGVMSLVHLMTVSPIDCHPSGWLFYIHIN
jgi:hypothetical protein